ncbi:redoxin domain-containing protein, partial [Escherichia sp. TWPC-MK]
SRANFTWVRSYVLCCFDFTQQVRRDPTGALTRNFDNMREDEGLADRATFVVDPQGIIQAIEVTAEGIGRDASDLLRKIKAAQYVASHPGEVCPAKWKEGEATLAPSLDLVGKI